MRQPSSIQDYARHGLPLDGLFIVDAHMHLGDWFQFYMPVRDAAGAVRLMDRIGITVGIASAHGAAIGCDNRAGNDLAIAAAKAFPGRFMGYIVADPNDAEGMAVEIERCAAAGLRAIKIHNYHGKPYDAPEYAPAYEIADQRSWPILAHSGSDLDVFGRLAARYKNIRWVLAHAADDNAGAFAALSRKHDNIFLDTAMSRCPVGAVEALVKGAGVEKVLFGSDAVFLSASQQIGKILFARLSDDEKASLLGQNAKAVFGLTEPEIKPEPIAK